MKKKLFLIVIQISLFFTGALPCIARQTGKTPNIIFVMADDHGYGDLACHGNPWIRTPNIDKLYTQSVRLTNYHSGTTCSPTRASLMTGKHFNRVGVWHTVMGRSLLRPGVPMLPEILKKGGYRTGIFGKWHLGDNYPLRPQDRGFDEVLIHKGGGVGQTPDFWNNDYFDDTYFHNGRKQKYTGYCTDVWFSEAMRFVEQTKDKPFFLYLALNAAHEPTHVPGSYSSLYQNNTNVPDADFYGMITNIDDNMGRLLSRLRELGLEENTVVIYTTDNGTTSGSGVQLNKDAFLSGKGFNAGMRGAKTSEYEGGHRVPFFLRFPAGKWPARDIPQLSSCMDVMPTLLDLSGIAIRGNLAFDGQSLLPLLRDAKMPWPNRTIIIDTQREDFMEKWKKSAVMTGQWRLINGTELYNIQEDPGQTTNLASLLPDTVRQLRHQYESWWADVQQRQNEYVRIALGGNENPVTLTAHDLHPGTKTMPAWHQVMIRNGNVPDRGTWMVNVEKAGEYEFQLKRWPDESGLANHDAAPQGEPIPGGKPYPAGKVFRLQKAFVNIGGQQKEMVLDTKQPKALVRLKLPTGATTLDAWFADTEGKEINAFYVYVRRVN